jgi:hydrogen peroxide-dependent heme synthase
MRPITPQEGWFVLHLFYEVDRKAWSLVSGPERDQTNRKLAEAFASFRQAENCQINGYVILGHKADLGFMLVDPELQHLSETENALLSAFPPGSVRPSYSYISMSEVSEYVSQEQDYDRTLRVKEGLRPESPEYQSKMEAFRQRIRFYVEERLYPQIPEHQVMCFYPMSKARHESDNWYTLDFESRKRLMGGHLISGRKYAGKVRQLVTGSTGLDAFEWGVTLFAEDPYYLKKIVYEMRYDEVSAKYGVFGDFLLGIRLEPDQLLARLRL